MNALVVEEFSRPPAWRSFAEPQAGADEVVVEVSASALSNLVKAQANGTHYSSVASFPFVPGVEGTGRLADRRIRWVQIGSIGGAAIALPAAALRSTGLELLGSGLGSVSDLELVRSIGEAFAVATRAGLAVEHERVPMSDGEAAWGRDFGRKRAVFTVGS